MNEGNTTMPRVALFTDTFTEVNGVAHTFNRMTEHFSRGGVGLDVFSYGESAGMRESGAVRVHLFDHKVSTGYYEKLRFELTNDVRVAREFRENHRRAPYSVVHLATPGSMGLVGRALALGSKIRVVGSYHTHFADYMAMRSMGALRSAVRKGVWSMMRWFYRPCDVVLCPTEGVVEELRSNGFRNRLGVFSRGIDTTAFSPARRSLGRDGRPTLLYVGRLAPEKSVGDLPKITAGLDARVVVVGDGPERGALERAMPGSEFLGYLKGDALARAYADADIFLFPSRTDTFANVVLEAMASGLVPVVPDASGPRDYVSNGVNAFVCRSVEEMRERTAMLVVNVGLRRDMAARAREFALDRSWGRVFDGLGEVYRGSWGS